jgi:uncharacterized protein
MRYKVKEIGEDGLQIQLMVRDAWLASEAPDAKVQLAPDGLCLEARLEMAGDSYLLQGALRGALVTPCARCLEDALVKVDIPMTFTFVEHFAGDGKAKTKVADEELAEDERVIFEHGVIDLGPTVRDELLLALPMKPICSESCLGICATCGTNRNMTQCTCSAAQRDDSPFAKLAKMKRE